MGDKRISERELVTNCCQLFKEGNNKVFLEVPIFSSSVDMVVLEGENILAIEFKINDWQRAINQAKKHFLAADYCYICIPKPKTPDACSRIESTIKETGVGLFYFKRDGELVNLVKAVEAKKSTMLWLAAKNSLVEFLNTIGGLEEGQSNEYEKTLKNAPLWDCSGTKVY
jgi:hypothetical protein